ncbi:MAG: hypothetical protein IKY04_06270 [Lachnospiraceae bacterium]|nr:hypothetical protein [Lachnospiraceae bacterium]
MYGLQKLLNDEAKRLSHIKEVVERNLVDAPDGSLRVSRNKRQTMLMHCTGENEKSRLRGNFIKKQDRDIAVKLAQKEYDLKLLNLVNKRLKQITPIQREYTDDEIESVYKRLHEVKQKMVKPVEEPWEQKLGNWKNTPYEGKGFEIGAPVILTKKGERVRSKSEKILADTFYDYGIEYKYECPLVLKGFGTIYPDFTFLKKGSDKELYWEHDGRMDDPDYCNSAIRKIDSYIKNGIFPGERLILTFETANCILNDVTVRRLIENYLI